MTATAQRPAEVSAACEPNAPMVTLRERIGRQLIALGQRIAGTNAASATAATGNDRFASLASMIPGVVYQRIVKPDGDIRYT